MEIETLEEYVKMWITPHYKEVLEQKIQEALPLLEAKGIKTPDDFRKKFSKGTFDYPEWKKFLRQLHRVLNGN